MDLKKIFLKDACPTSIGGQAVIEGIMMRGPDRTAVAVRTPDKRIFLKTTKNGPPGIWTKIPIVRGVVSFIMSLYMGTKTLTYAADALEKFDSGDTEEKEEPGRLEKWFLEKFGEEKLWKMLMALSVVIAVIVAVAVFVLLPTALVSLLGKVIENAVVLNLIEGLFRIAIFILYIALISRMDDIRRVFEYHGAEHKTIHCFENGLELTPENAKSFYTLHPRCGTSFLMFVMVVSLVLFSLFGWPSLAWRLLSRIVLIPVVAGLSYELLKWAGRSDNKIVEMLSIPGLLLQKLTTREPDREQLEVAIAAMKAVLVPSDAKCVEGICDNDANILEEIDLASMKKDPEKEQESDPENESEEEREL